MATRKALSKKLRFEVFKRDNFKCQYCGRTAPDVVLVVDHIEPVKVGGDNNILNLITSCQECNSGKGARLLTDGQVLDQQRQQLVELNARREQMKMMIDWKNGLMALENEQVEEIEKLVLTPYDRSLTDSGKVNIRKYIKEFGFAEVLEASIISRDRYFKPNDDTCFSNIIKYIPGICANRQRDATDPTYSRKLYMIGVLKNRFYYTEYQMAQLKRKIYALDISASEIEAMIDLSKTVASKSDFDDHLETYEV